MNIREELFELQDKEYAAFQGKLTPGVNVGKIIGVRVPEARKLAKKIVKAGEYRDFLNELPHEYYDENMLHGLVLSEIKNYEECIAEVDKFLPFVDNWAVCDIMSPKIFKKNKDVLIAKIEKWAFDSHTYTCRFGMEMLMTHFLDEEFKSKYLEIPAAVQSEEYYVRMMVAWFYATALAKQWEATIPYLEKGILDVWSHNKTIQKARESYRISQEQKEYLKTLKR